jgi:RNA polymerase sigma-70 factor (ECF subfamily)
MLCSATTDEMVEEATVAAGDFEALYLRWVGPVFRFCVSQLRDRAVAEDVTAEVFTAALAGYRRVDAAGIGPWLFRIARNAVVDEHRRRARRGRLLDRLRRRPEAGADPIDDVSRRDEVARACAAVAALRPRARELVGLRVAGQLSYAEIAAVVGISETAAKVATHRALAVVRRTLREEEEEA